MYFSDDILNKIKGYGVGATTANGRCHLLAFCEKTGRVHMLCQSTQKQLNGHSGNSPQWFKDEALAVRALRFHKNACQKCLRSIETIDMETI